MQIQKLVPQTENIEISEITLLSVMEAKALSRAQLNIGSWWWLRSPGRSTCAARVLNDGKVNAAGIYVYDSRGTGVRPALRISNLGASNLNVGEKFSAGGETWTVISKDLALCDHVVGHTCFREDWKAPDANVYEKSDVKKWLENWALEKGIYTTAQKDIYVNPKSNYNNDDIQKMLETLRDPEHKQAFLQNLTCSPRDKLAILDCIADGYYERFDRYDSDVCEIFIATYEAWLGMMQGRT